MAEESLYINEKIRNVAPDFQSFGRIAQKNPSNAIMYFDGNSWGLGFMLFGLLSALSGTVIALIGRFLFKNQDFFLIVKEDFLSGEISQMVTSLIMVVAFLLPFLFFLSLLVFGMRKLLDSFMSLLAAKKGKPLFGIFTLRNHIILSMEYNNISVIPFRLIRSIKGVTKKESAADSISKIRKIEFVYFSPEDQVEYCLEYITGPLHHRVTDDLKKAIGIP